MGSLKAPTPATPNTSIQSTCEAGTKVLHVRDATMRLNETALQREKLDEENQSSS